MKSVKRLEDKNRVALASSSITLLIEWDNTSPY